MKTIWRLLTIGAVLAVGGNAPADYPVPALMSEMQPPTAEDWHRLQLRQMQRCCPFCGPIVIPREIHYYPCPPEQPCGQPVLQSFKGVYGSEHPMPYYRPNPQIVVHVPGRCPRCQFRQHSPSGLYVPQGLPTISEKSKD